jgi:hypothetical protein
MHFFNASLPNKMAFQIWEAYLFLEADIKSQSWKYLPLRTIAHTDSRFEINLHPSLVEKRPSIQPH